MTAIEFIAAGILIAMLGFVAGLLVGRKHESKVEQIVQGAKKL